MKIGKDELEFIQSLLEESEQLQPMVKVIVKLVGDNLAELAPLIDKFSKWQVKKRITSIARFQAAGFTKEEAMLLTMDESLAIATVSKNIKLGK